jgi:hypothetical protein
VKSSKARKAFQTAVTAKAKVNPTTGNATLTEDIEGLRIARTPHPDTDMHSVAVACWSKLIT